MTEYFTLLAVPCKNFKLSSSNKGTKESRNSCEMYLESQMGVHVELGDHRGDDIVRNTSCRQTCWKILSLWDFEATMMVTCLDGAMASSMHGATTVDDQLVDGSLPRGSRLGHNRPADIANARGQGLKDGRNSLLTDLRSSGGHLESEDEAVGRLDRRLGLRLQAVQSHLVVQATALRVDLQNQNHRLLHIYLTMIANKWVEIPTGTSIPLSLLQARFSLVPFTPFSIESRF
ncbi:hypothetical protein WR25_08150 [Diploscapter pachys]|uniref:Uncharacterized protein n=1 Tax=Diploscapter pachys TaxID=2018661 RepID=A0A2A2LST3_9BILA|nr:hypothetical protein WR25_08150 [Diploscapter pachys]